MPNLKLPFVKMQGLGNDFIVIDDIGKVQAIGRRPEVTPELARKICDRRFGVGADQVLWLRPAHSREMDARMEILNADGSIAEMCGNGIRAIGLYLAKHGPIPNRVIYSIETLAGIKTVQIHGDEVTVDMGAPKLAGGFESTVSGPGSNVWRGPGEKLEVAGRVLEFFEVDMGNPHAVVFVEDVAAVALEEIGPKFEVHSRFPARTNVEFVQVLGPDQIRVRVWERGAGVTLACGTGACASAVAALATGRVQGEVKVDLPGGQLKIVWPGPAQSVVMAGPAAEVFRGEFWA